MIIAVVGTVVIGGTVLWSIFRRPKRLKEPPGENMYVATKLSEKEREAIKVAFLAGPDFQWLANGDSSSPSDDAEERHRSVTYYMLECILTFAENYGHVITYRDPSDGSFLGSICLIPPYTSKWLYSIHFLSSVIPLGTPVPVQMGSDVAARFNAFTDTCEIEHQRLMKDQLHWYICNLGVTKQAQGKGVGRKLLQTAFEVAGDMPVYLECHDGNVTFYEKMGFSTASKFFFKPKKTADESGFPFNGMIYKKSTE